MKELSSTMEIVKVRNNAALLVSSSGTLESSADDKSSKES